MKKKVQFTDRKTLDFLHIVRDGVVQEWLIVCIKKVFHTVDFFKKKTATDNNWSRNLIWVSCPPVVTMRKTFNLNYRQHK